MDSRQTIITPNEVKKYSPADTQDSTAIKENFIILKEESLFNEFFGYSFYLDLLSKVIDYETLVTYKGDFDPSDIYSVGDSVQLVDELFECIQLTTPGISPKQKAFWKRAPKFTDDNYNFLWERYLRQVLAWNVLYTSVLFAALQSSSKGLIKQKSESFESASLKELQTYKEVLYNDVQQLCYLMDLYIRRNPENFPLYKPILDSSCEVQSNKKRQPNYGFNVGGSGYSYKKDLNDLGE